MSLALTRILCSHLVCRGSFEIFLYFGISGVIFIFSSEREWERKDDSNWIMRQWFLWNMIVCLFDVVTHHRYCYYCWITNRAKIGVDTWKLLFSQNIIIGFKHLIASQNKTRNDLENIIWSTCDISLESQALKAQHKLQVFNWKCEQNIKNLMI